MANGPSEQLSATSNPIGLAGFITSLVGIVSCGVLCPIGLILSAIGLFKRPKGFAIAGFVIGLLGSLGIIIVVLVVGVVFIGLLIALAAAGPAGIEMFGDTVAITEHVKQYQAQNASLPATLVQVSGLTPDELKDHWGHEYIYKPDLVNNTFSITSMGPDGTEGTNDDMTVQGSSFFTGPTPP